MQKLLVYYIIEHWCWWVGGDYVGHNESSNNIVLSPNDRSMHVSITKSVIAYYVYYEVNTQ